MEEAERQRCLQVITGKLVGLTAGCVLVLSVVFYVLYPCLQRTFLVAIVFVAGVIGGFVSMQQRLPTIGLDELHELAGSWPSIPLVPVNGGIFAVVLMLMFACGIIQGALFPEYMHPIIDHSHLVDSFLQWLRDVFSQGRADCCSGRLSPDSVSSFVPQIIRKTAETAEKE